MPRPVVICMERRSAPSFVLEAFQTHNTLDEEDQPPRVNVSDGRKLEDPSM
jgi:hypothetical protein